MSIGNVNGVGPVTSLQNDLRASTDAASQARHSAAASGAQQQEIDESTQQPRPPRFPWLSRLSQQLEAASQQRSAFGAAPELGDNLDRTA